jgi:hypothetical protein
MKTNDEEYMSDNSVDTDELNEVNEDVYETKVKKGIDRTTNKTVKVKKSKPIPIKKKPVKQIKEDLKEELVEEEEVVNEVIEEPVKPKKPLSEARLAHMEKMRKAREDKAKMTKNAVNTITKKIKKEIPEKTVYREKIIYMIPTNNGFIETDSIPKLTKKEMKYLDNDEMVTKQELEVGKKILRRKDGSADGRSRKREQTEKQKEATKKMLEANKKRRDAKKKEKQETLGQEVKKAVVDVVTKPIDQVKKEIEKPTNNEPQKKIYDFSKIIPF